MASALSCRCQPTVRPRTGMRRTSVLDLSRCPSPTAAATPPRARAKSRSSNDCGLRGSRVDPQHRCWTSTSSTRQLAPIRSGEMYAPASSTSTSLGSGSVGERTGASGARRNRGPSLPIRPLDFTCSAGANARRAASRSSAVRSPAPTMPRSSSMPSAYSLSSPMADTVDRRLSSGLLSWPGESSRPTAHRLRCAGRAAGGGRGGGGLAPARRLKPGAIRGGVTAEPRRFVRLARR